MSAMTDATSAAEGKAATIEELTLEQYLARVRAEQKIQSYTVRNANYQKRKVTGWLIATDSTQSYQGPHSSRWTEFDLYMLRDARFVLATKYITFPRWQGESNSYKLEFVDSLNLRNLREGLRHDLVDEPILKNVKITDGIPDFQDDDVLAEAEEE